MRIYSRDIDMLALASGIESLDLKETVRHAEVNRFTLNKMSPETGDDFADRLDERTHLDGADCSSWIEPTFHMS